MLVMGMNFALFVAISAVAMNQGGQNAIMNGPGGELLVAFGAKWAPYINSGQVWRLVTADFLHIGILHLLFNSFALFQIAPLVEESYGSQKFIFIYLVTGIGGFAASTILAPDNVAAGASSSLFGLIGLVAVFGYRMGGMAGRGLMRQMLIWAGINFVFGMMVGRVDNFAHLGGMVSGAALGLVIAPSHPDTQREVNLWNVIAIVCAVVIMGSFACVGLTYGNTPESAPPPNHQRAQSVIDLNVAIQKAGTAFDKSLAWKPGQESDNLSSDLRSTASDLEKIPHIDEKGDNIKAQFIALARKRADALDAAAKKPASPNTSLTDADDRKAWSAANDQYDQWLDSVLKDYGLQKSNKQGSEK